jgi:hypothetical protein
MKTERFKIMDTDDGKPRRSAFLTAFLEKLFLAFGFAVAGADSFLSTTGNFHSEVPVIARSIFIALGYQLVAQYPFSDVPGQVRFSVWLSRAMQGSCCARSRKLLRLPAFIPNALPFLAGAFSITDFLQKIIRASSGCSVMHPLKRSAPAIASPHSPSRQNPSWSP